MPYTCIRLQITTTVLLTCRPANLYRTCGRIVRDVGFAYQFTATYKLPYSWPVVEPKRILPGSQCQTQSPVDVLCYQRTNLQIHIATQFSEKNLVRLARGLAWFGAAAGI